MDEVLKPCPFCGGEAVSREYDERNPYEPFGLIIAHAEDCFLALHSSYDEYETRWNTRADAAPTPKADEVEAVARAIKSASCPGREGPFGGYDYGHNEAFYGPAPEGGRYVIRDFRDPSSPDWGAWLHQTNDRDEHESMFARMTDDHVAQAAIAALDAVRGDADPVAWRYVRKPEEWPPANPVVQSTRWLPDDPARPFWIEQPLYAHPPRGDQVARVVEWLRKENGLCDCHARCETECGCGAWDDWKTKPLLEIATAIERGEPFNG